MKNILNKYCPIVVGSFVVLAFALYNSFPIVTNDTTTYITSGFQLIVPDDRPIFYGLFLRITSLGISLWLTCFAQSLLLSYVLIKFIKFIAPTINNLKVTGLLLLISLTTIAGWYSGQLMPDIFTAILFVALADFLLLESDRKTAVLFLGIAFLATLMHNSHYIIATLFSTLLFSTTFLFESFRILRRKSLGLLSGSLIAWICLFSSNYVAHKGFVPSNSSHAFLMGKLAESGILKTYLDRRCPSRNYNICKYKDHLPPVAWEFVWDGNAPMAKEGGMIANKAEYTEIIHDITSRPKYWPFMVFKSIEATARQIVLPNIDEGEERAWVKYEKEHPLYQCIEKYFPHEINEFVVSKQNQKTLNIKLLDEIFVIVIVVSSVLILFGLDKELAKEAKIIYLLLFAFLLINAFVTATFGNVLTRLNSRAIWLLPAVNMIYIYKIMANKFNTKPKQSLDLHT